MNNSIFDYILFLVVILFFIIHFTLKKQPRQKTEEIKRKEVEKEQIKTHYENALIAFLVIMGCLSILLSFYNLSEELNFFYVQYNIGFWDLNRYEQILIITSLLILISLGLTQIIVAWLIKIHFQKESIKKTT